MNHAEQTRQLTVIRDTLLPVATMKGVVLAASDLLIWAEALAFHRVNEVEFAKAMRVWAITEKFFPMPVEIMELAKGEASGNRRLVAVNRLQELIEIHGPYRGDVVLEDPVMALTVEQMGGWTQVAAEFTTVGPYYRDFMKAYENNQRVLPVAGHGNRLAFEVAPPRGSLGFDAESETASLPGVSG